MRLGDATNQTVANIDFGEQSKGFVTWKPEKTEHLQRIVILPLHSNLHQHLLAMKNAGVQTQFTPRLAVIRRPEQCTKFKQVLIATGIDPEDYTLTSILTLTHSKRRLFLRIGGNSWRLIPPMRRTQGTYMRGHVMRLRCCARTSKR